MMKVAKLAVALTLSSAVVVAAWPSDANAQERERRGRNRQQPANAGPTVSPAFRAAYTPVDTAIKASNWAAADAALPALITAAQTPYERFLVAQSDYQIGNGTSNAARARTAIDAMIDSGGAPAEAATRLVVASSQMAYQAQDFAKAAARAAQAQQMGSTETILPVIQIDSLFRSGQADQGIALANQLISAGEAAGRPVSLDIYNSLARGLQQANRDAELDAMLLRRAIAYPAPANIRNAGIIHLQLTADVPRAVNIAIMRAMIAGNVMGANQQDSRAALLEHARNLSDAGLPSEAISVVQAAVDARVIRGDSNPSDQIITGDASFQEVVTNQRPKLAEDRASLANSERLALASPEAGRATRTGNAYLGYQNYAKAEQLFTAALGKNGVDADQVNLELGIARFGAGNMVGALEAFGRSHGAFERPARLWEAVTRARQEAAAAAATPPVPPATPAAPTPPAQ